MTFRCLSDDSEIGFEWLEIKTRVRLELKLWNRGVETDKIWDKTYSVEAGITKDSITWMAMFRTYMCNR